jgi:hypothetical protein
MDQRRRWKKRALQCLAVAVLVGSARMGKSQSDLPPSRSVPAATFARSACAGFISASPLPNTISVFNGADNDLYEPLHEFTVGDYIYLQRTDHRPFVAGQVYSLVRPETGFHLQPAWLPGMLENEILPPASLYSLQRFDIKSLGRPYDRTGIVRVTKVTAQGAIAKVEFTCNGVNIGDLAQPYSPQAIPQYTPSTRLSPFSLPNGKLSGIIVAAAHGGSVLGQGGIGFLNIGGNEGVLPGQRFRIFTIFRDNLPETLGGGLTPKGQTPRETIGEFVVLHVEEKAATGIVVDSRREIAVGDGVELE